MSDNSKGFHLRANTVFTIIIAIIVIVLGIRTLTLTKRLSRFEIAQRVDPIRMRTIVSRINMMSPKIPKGETLEYARVIASQQQYVQPVAMAMLERETGWRDSKGNDVGGYYMHAEGKAGERGGMQLLPGTIRALTRWVSFSEKELATSIEANTIGGLTWWQMHYAAYGDIAKASSGYNGLAGGKAFPTEYGIDIARRVKIISAWMDSVDAVQLHTFKSQTR